MGSKTSGDILKGYLWALDKMRPTLSTLFKAAVKQEEDRDRLPLGFDLLQVMEWAATLDRAQEIYTASIFLVLDQWIKALGKNLRLKNTNGRFGEKIGKTSLTELIRATANNFRHHGDWDKPTDMARANIRILSDAGIHDVSDSIVAPQVLQVLGVRTYEELEAKLRDIGQDMLAQAEADQGGSGSV